MQHMNRKIIILVIIMSFFIGLGTAFYRDLSASPQRDNISKLVVYCAAGVRVPVELLAQEYEEISGVNLDLIYGSSGNLRSQIVSRGAGDIYIPGDPRFLDDTDYVAAREIAYHSPALVVNASQEHHIGNLHELLNSNISFVLVNPDSTALGEMTEVIIEGIGLSDQIKTRLYGRVATANQVPLYVSLVDGLAGISWYSNCLINKEDLTIIELPKDLQMRIPIIGVVLKISEQQEKAEDFLHFLKSDRANQVFKKWGYEIED